MFGFGCWFFSNKLFKIIICFSHKPDVGFPSCVIQDQHTLRSHDEESVSTDVGFFKQSSWEERKVCFSRKLLLYQEG